jgi:predicted dehydrogenase
VTLRIGVIGAGYWGPNLIRNFMLMNDVEVACVADLDTDRLAHMKKLYNVNVTTDHHELIADPAIDVVAIATPVHTHHRLAAEALQANKHVFVEKPLAASSAQCEELIELALRRRRKLMVGHTFVYTAAVQKMRAVIANGELGELYYINSQRLNLGLFQKDINVVWDLAPHDISILLYLLGRDPISVAAVGMSHVNPFIEDVATITLSFEGSVIAFIQSSWLDPDKIRRMTLVGSRKMLVYDDIEPTSKIRIYDKSVEKPRYYDNFAEFAYSYKYGDITIPQLKGGEPVRNELEHFVDCIQNDTPCLSDGHAGLKVVRILEASMESLRQGGRQIPIDLEPPAALGGFREPGEVQPQAVRSRAS